MNKILFPILAIILTACTSTSPQTQVTVTSEATSTAAPTLPPPTMTIVPTPTLSPEFLDLQAQVDATGTNLTLGSEGIFEQKMPDGTFQDIVGIHVNPATNQIEIMINGAPVIIDRSQISFAGGDLEVSGYTYDSATGLWSAEIVLPTITLVNGAGENITILEFGVDAFDANIQYIADKVKWEQGDRKESIFAFGLNNPELDSFLAQFEGVPGFIIKKHWSANSLPMISSATIPQFFNVYSGTCGEGTLLIFETKDGGFEAVYTDLEIKEFWQETHDSPLMPNLRP